MNDSPPLILAFVTGIFAAGIVCLVLAWFTRPRCQQQQAFICAWCKKTTPGHMPATHGMCDDCHAEENKRWT